MFGGRCELPYLRSVFLFTMNIPDSHQPRVVIIGSGFGGINLVKRLRGSSYQVVLLDKNNYHTFQPLLYQVATAGLEPDSIAYPVRKIFKGQGNFFFRNCRVLGFDAQTKTVRTDIGELAYDHLVLAMGSKTNYFGNANIEAMSMPMKSVPEALNLRSLILQNFEGSLLTTDLKERERLMNYVIVGGGPTGVELAGALAELKNHVLPADYPDLDLRRMTIHLIEAGPRLLPAMSETAGEGAAGFLNKMGVQLWVNTLVKDYDGALVETNKKPLPASTLIWAAGVTGALIDGLPPTSVERGRVLVNDFLEVKDLEGVYAIGDLALQRTEAVPQGDPMVAQTAIQHGKLLGNNLRALATGKKQKPFRYKDLGSMATVGRNKAVVDIGMYKSKGFIAWVIWMFIHLIQLVGFRNRLVALSNWMVNYFTYDKGIRLIIRPYKRSSPG